MKTIQKVLLVILSLITVLTATLILTSCKGEQGEKGEKGDQGAQGVQGFNGERGEKGEPGVGIKSIQKFSSEENIDTYMIIFTDGSTETFTVTNGLNGEDGRDGEDGRNGINGSTPYIGYNGNWWINYMDTGIQAKYEVCTCDCGRAETKENINTETKEYTKTY